MYADLPRGGKIAVRTVMRPEPDLKLLAKAVWSMALRDVQDRARRERVLNRAAIRTTYPPAADGPVSGVFRPRPARRD